MRSVLCVALLLLAGCEKSFDERYAAAEKKVREQAASIDRDMAERQKAAQAAPATTAAASDSAKTATN